MAAPPPWAATATSPPQPVADRALSMAAHVVASGQPLVVGDVLRDARYGAHPGLADRGIRFFAAAPLLDDAGHAMGALCVMDTEPRQLNQRDVMLLENLAADVVTTAHMKRDERAQAATDAADTAASAASEAPAPDEPAPGAGGAQPAPA